MPAKPTVYLETTIPSYLTARPSRDVIIAGQQEITRLWWEMRRKDFTLCVSSLVRQEASRGDSDAARRRLNLLSNLPALAYDSETNDLRTILDESGLFPAKASVDAAHISIASRHGADYLLTWNCRHIANMEINKALKATIEQAGYNLPILCTPHELLGESEHVREPHSE